MPPHIPFPSFPIRNRKFLLVRPRLLHQQTPSRQVPVIPSSSIPTLQDKGPFARPVPTRLTNETAQAPDSLGWR